MKDRISFEAVVGSQNYNLTTPNSDTDLKIFRNPTFDDLYKGDKSSIGNKSVELDVEKHDIRKLPNLLYKANVNFTEVLFSINVKSYDDLYMKLKPLRNDIAKMNLRHLYDACRGMFQQKYRDFQRDLNYINVSEIGTEAYYVKMGKHASSAYRPLDFLQRFEETEFNDFFRAMHYDDKDEIRDFIIFMKSGETKKLNELDKVLKLKDAELSKLKEVYYAHQIDEELNLHVQQIVKDHIKSYLKNEL